jgi:DNA modification methylase
MLHIGDCREWARGLAPGSVQTVVTSPPYFGLRSYLPADHPDKARELGGEQTPDEFVANLVALFRDLRAALRDDGTLWLNLGDSYARTGGTDRNVSATAIVGSTRNTLVQQPDRTQKAPSGLKDKDLIGIPWMTAFALRADGWYLRSAITWCKRAPMPESVTDRPTSATEMVFLFAKQPTYYYDATAIAEPASEAPRRQLLGRLGVEAIPGRTGNGHPQRGHYGNGENGATRNSRNWWLLGPSQFADAHFATFPPEIPRRAIRAGTSEKGACARCGAPWRRVVESDNPSKVANVGEDLSGGAFVGRTANPQTSKGLHRNGGGVYSSRQVLGWEPSCRCGTTETRPCVVADPFMGSGTTAAVAVEENRAWVGCDLDSRAAGWLQGRLARVQRRLPLAV